MEVLATNGLSPKVIKNYFSSICSFAPFYNLDAGAIAHPAVHRYVRSLSITSPFRPTPRGIFCIKTMYDISKTCDFLPDPPLFRAIFLVAFYAFFRLSNIAPHSVRQFSKDRHFLRQDLIFAPLVHIYWSNGPRPFKMVIPHTWFKFPKLKISSYVQLEP